MDDELKRRLAAALDLPPDAVADADVIAALERDPVARAYAQGLYAIEDALARWPVREHDAAASERLARAIEARLGDAPWESAATGADAIQPLSWEASDRPPLHEDADERAADKPEHKPMAQSHDDKDNDEDMAGLAALARSSLSPGAPSVRPSMKPGPSLHDDAMDESSGIVDIQKLAQIALRQSNPPPAGSLRPARSDIDPVSDSAVAAGEMPTARDSTKPATVAAAPAPNTAAAERAREVRAATAPFAEPGRTKSSPMKWMLPLGAAVAVGGWFAYSQFVHPSAEQVAVAPTGATNDAPAAASPPAAAPIVAAAPSVAAAPPAEAPAPPTVANAEPAQAAAQPSSGQPAATQPAAVAAPEPTVAARDSAQHVGDGRGHAQDVAATESARVTAPATHAAHGTAATAGPAREVAAAEPAAPPPPPAAPATHETLTATATTTTAAAEGRAGGSHAAPGAAAGSGGHPQSIDDLMNRAVGGEHPAAAAAPAPTEQTLPARPTRAQVTDTLTPLTPAVRACTQGATGTATAAMVIRNDGNVQTVNVSGPFDGTVTSCIQGVVRRAHFPAFSQPTVPLVYPFVIQPPH